MEYEWSSRSGENGAQIDLLIDRDDHVINVCEMKYSRSPFVIDAAYRKNLEKKLEFFSAETGTKKALHLTLISAAGMERNAHSEVVQNVITGDDLFQ